MEYNNMKIPVEATVWKLF